MSTAQLLAENRYLGKRSAAKGGIGQCHGVPGIRKQTKKKAPKTPLQALLIKRLQEEIERRGWSRNMLGLKSEELGGPPQRTVNDIFNGADPRLETVYYLASALGIHPWQLLTNGDHQAKGHNVQDFPTPPRMLGKDGRENQKLPAESPQLRRDRRRR